MGCQNRSNLLKDETGDLLADSHNTLNRSKNYSQLLNVHRVSDVGLIEIYTSEPSVPDLSHVGVETAVAKLKMYKSPGSDQIPAELIQAEGETLWSEIHKLINSLWNKEELHDQWKESIIVPIYQKSDITDCSNYHGISLLSASYRILSNILLSWLSAYINKIIGDHQCGF
jgi:hypothetical protein